MSTRRHHEIARRIAHLTRCYRRRGMAKWQYLRFLRCILAEFSGGSRKRG